MRTSPLSGPPALPCIFVARLARERVKVVLTGEGSDETLAGYSRYAFTLKNAAFDRVYRGVVPARDSPSPPRLLATSTWIGATPAASCNTLSRPAMENLGPRLYFDNFFSAFSAVGTDRTADR